MLAQQGTVRQSIVHSPFVSGPVADGAFAPTTVAGQRDVALLLIGWYGALRRSELAELHRAHIGAEDSGVVLQLPTSKTRPWRSGPTGRRTPAAALTTTTRLARAQRTP